jgi:hypothetical protein
MAFIPIAGAHTSAKQQKSVIDLLRERRAVQRAAAQPMPQLSASQRRRMGHLVDRDIVRLVAGNRYYLDEEALGELHSRQRALTFSVVVIAAGVAAAFVLI